MRQPRVVWDLGVHLRRTACARSAHGRYLWQDLYHKLQKAAYKTLLRPILEYASVAGKPFYPVYHQIRMKPKRICQDGGHEASAGHVSWSSCKLNSVRLVCLVTLRTWPSCLGLLMEL